MPFSQKLLAKYKKLYKKGKYCIYIIKILHEFYIYLISFYNCTYTANILKYKLGRYGFL